MNKKKTVLSKEALNLMNVLSEYPNMQLTEEHRKILEEYREQIREFLDDASTYLC